jgi:hypothetical protein
MTAIDPEQLESLFDTLKLPKQYAQIFTSVLAFAESRAELDAVRHATMLDATAAQSLAVRAAAKKIALELELLREALTAVTAAIYDHTKQAFHTVR